MDPPEHLPPDPEVDESVAVSGTTSPNRSHNMSNTESYYSQQPEEVSKADDSQYSEDHMSPDRGDAPSYDEHGETPQYSYSMSPDKESYYDQEQSRDDQYYDSPEQLKNTPGSQDHEFFNAPSGGGEDEEEYEPSMVSSFDPHSHLRHPDDITHGEMTNEHPYDDYYDEDDPEDDSRLELKESESSDYYRGNGASPSPIKVDHLRQLGRKNQQSSPRRGTSAMASPMSQASSQNSVSEYSHSSAMRGAQELLKRNRQRRHEQ